MEAAGEHAGAYPRAASPRASARWWSPATSNSNLPVGARYALIGPNGAGKTTLINLMTGMLAPNAGQIFLGGEDITALEPQERVRRGLARTFQINTLFAGLNALEAVTLAVAERRGIAGQFWQNIAVAPRGDRGSLRHPGASCGSAMTAISRRANCLMAASGCWKSRWRWRPSRKCCCSTSRPPACRRRKAATFSRWWRACPTISRCCSSSTTCMWCSASPPTSSCWSAAAIFTRRLAGRNRRRSGRARSLSGDAQTWLRPLLVGCKQVTAGYGDAVVLHDISLELPEHGSLAVLGRNGVGKSTLLLTIMGYTQLRGGHVSWRGQDISQHAAAPPRRQRHRLGGAGARNLSLADGGGKSHRRRAAGRLDARRRIQAVSAPGRAPPQHGQSIVGRRAADAGDRARADDQSGVAAAGRAVRRPGAGDRR